MKICWFFFYWSMQTDTCIPHAVVFTGAPMRLLRSFCSCRCLLYIEPKSSIQALCCYEYPGRASGYLDLQLLLVAFSALSLRHNDSMMMMFDLLTTWCKHDNKPHHLLMEMLGVGFQGWGMFVKLGPIRCEMNNGFWYHVSWIAVWRRVFS
jgi:hypothetical protein